MTATSRRPASISLDLDDLWTYLRTHGDASWASRPSYLQEFVPLVLDELDKARVSLTFFVVGSDAAQPRNRPLLRAMIERGHEIGNHSYEHQPYFHLFNRERARAEVVRTQDAIADATGQRPVGFRGPGYSWSPDLLEILADEGYLYDASTLPTYLGPLARAYYFWTARLTREERIERSHLFGGFRDGTRPLKPYEWQLVGDRRLLEMPVTTMPGLKIPFHLSYLHYLSRFSEPLAMGYLRTALALCRASRTPFSIILHPLDILGSDQVSQLAFFPGMDLPTERKLRLFHRVLQQYAGSFSLVPMSVHARALSAGARLARRHPEHLPVQSPLIEG
jgi:peptidoglycan-N-acetylglucosamine deacetylase